MSKVNVRLVGFPDGTTEVTLEDLPLTGYLFASELPEPEFVEVGSSPLAVAYHVKAVPIKQWGDGHRVWWQADWKDAR